MFFEIELTLSPETPAEISKDSQAAIQAATETLIQLFENLQGQLESAMDKHSNASRSKRSTGVARSEDPFPSHSSVMLNHLENSKKVLSLYLKLLRTPNGIKFLRLSLSNVLNTQISFDTELKNSSVYHPRISAYFNFFYDCVVAPYLNYFSSSNSVSLSLTTSPFDFLLTRSGALNQPIRGIRLIRTLWEKFTEEVDQFSKASQSEKLLCSSLMMEKIKQIFTIRTQLLTLSNEHSTSEKLASPKGRKFLQAARLCSDILTKSFVMGVVNQESSAIDISAFQTLQAIKTASMYSNDAYPCAAFEISMLTDLDNKIKNSQHVLEKVGLGPLVKELSHSINNDKTFFSVDLLFSSICYTLDVNTAQTMIAHKDAFMGLKAHQEEQFRVWHETGSRILDHLTSQSALASLEMDEKQQLFECLQLLERTLQQWALDLFIFAYFCKKVYDNTSQSHLVKGLRNALAESTLLQKNFIPEGIKNLIFDMNHIPPLPSNDISIESEPEPEQFADDIIAELPLPGTPTTEPEELESVDPEIIDITEDNEERNSHKSLKTQGKQKAVLEPEEVDKADSSLETEDTLDELITMLKKRGLKWEKLIKILTSLGGRIVRTTGSHQIVEFGKGGPSVPVPKRAEQARGTQLSIAKQVASALAATSPQGETAVSSSSLSRESSVSQPSKSKNKKK